MYTISVNNRDIQQFRICRAGGDLAVITAATELEKYLQLRNGDFETEGMIFVGLVSEIPTVAQFATQLREDGILIKIEGSNIYIAGVNGRGVIYAAYEFLEKYCGWGFYAPDVEKEPVGAINLENLEHIFNPQFDYRMNLLPSAGDGTAHFRKRHLNARWGTIPEPEEFGGSITFATKWNCHTFSALLPPEVYFEEHPEYFAMNKNGERVLEKTIEHTQPCLSNPEVFEIILQNLKKDLRAHPNARYASVSQNDGGAFCHCEACRKVNEEEETDGGTIYRFVNRIAEAIEEEFPNVMIDTLAYNYSTKPPAKTVMRDNVSVLLCLMIACREHAIMDESCSYNAKVRQYLTDWGKVCNHIRIWDYAANFFNYPMSVMNFKLLYQNVHYLRNFPIKGILFQGAHTTNPDIEFSALWGYLQSKLAWNPDMTYVEYLNCAKEFLYAYYGEGAQFIYDYLMLMMQQPSSDYHYGPGATCEQIIPMLRLPDGRPNMSFIQDANDLFDLAEAASSGEALERVRRTRLHLTWYELCTTYSYICTNGTEEEKKALSDKYEKFINTVNKWERFCVRETVEGKMYGKQFDFEVNPNLFIGA